MFHDTHDINDVSLIHTYFIMIGDGNDLYPK